ncbi:GNAT family N-acetyltransferase [Mycobacterium sp. URHB0044]|jgi:N-acetylglutamate synthase-like GNAT family acetyltransferase|uniref:GNAT family N-acetyltransferase n=1 Tax=Mycobacterium sp. URHB0044 TaxID=1380386 RepID=UPI00048E1A01|nr:GNAT family N-acetyltransferase [Mycobacterium sp. URHB0044]
MDEPVLRGATKDDVDAIEGLAKDAFGKYVERIGRPPAPMVADYAALLRESRIWVIEERDAIVAMLVTQHHGDHLLLETIAVASDAQGSGHGRRLLQRAERDATEQGLTEVRLCTNEAMTENLVFYPRHGYRETRRGIEDGYRRVFFVKNLAESSATSPA